MRESSAHVDVDRSRYPVKGIDVSAHNGAVNYARVAADTVSFVLAKASEGVSFRDKKFVMNVESARRQGLRTGAYHFFRFDTPGFRQAQNFLRAVDGVVLDFPLIIDVEEWGNAETFTTAEVVADNVYFGDSKRDGDGGSYGDRGGSYGGGSYGGSYGARPSAPSAPADYGIPSGGDQFAELADDDGDLPF